MMKKKKSILAKKRIRFGIIGGFLAVTSIITLAVLLVNNNGNKVRANKPEFPRKLPPIPLAEMAANNITVSKNGQKPWERAVRGVFINKWPDYSNVPPAALKTGVIPIRFSKAGQKLYTVWLNEIKKYKKNAPLKTELAKHFAKGGIFHKALQLLQKDMEAKEVEISAITLREPLTFKSKRVTFSLHLRSKDGFKSGAWDIIVHFPGLVKWYYSTNDPNADNDFNKPEGRKLYNELVEELESGPA